MTITFQQGFGTRTSSGARSEEGFEAPQRFFLNPLVLGCLTQLVYEQARLWQAHQDVLPGSLLSNDPSPVHARSFSHP